MRTLLAIFLVLTQIASAQRDITGKVCAQDACARTLQLEGNEQVFAISPGDALIAYTGKTIRAQQMEGRLESIWPANPSEVRVVADTTAQLHHQIIAKGTGAYRGQGDYIFNFALYNQLGELITRPQLQGKYVALNFIFTRCTVAQVCPAATRRMVELAKALQSVKESLPGPVRLISISFDPLYDTPGVLAQYGQAYGVDPSIHWLLTGDKGQIDDLRRAFGILTKNEKGELVHTSATLLIDDKGKIIDLQTGSAWSADQIIEKLKSLVKASNPATS